MKIYGVTGMPLAGKTTVADIIAVRGFQKIDMGDVVRKEMSDRNISAGETGKFVNQQREKRGRSAIAKLTVPYIERTDSDVVITGMRGLSEKKHFEKDLGTEIEMIAVWTSPKKRKERREKRMREEDRKGQDFHSRDLRELENGVGKLMALSDHVIVNEDISIEKLEEKVDQLLEA